MQAPVADPTGVEELLLEVRLNRQPSGEAVLVLRRPDGGLLVRDEDLRRWRLRLPESAPLVHGGEAFRPLDALLGLSWQFDEASQTLLLEAGPALFDTTRIAPRGVVSALPSPAVPGGFLNYDLNLNRAQGTTQAGALMELGGFGPWGTGVTSVLVQDIGRATRFVRLDTTWTHDRPADLATLRVGDAISAAGSWGRSVRFGGLQWATNFATRPDFVAFPLPTLAGEAVLPSTVDLYVDNALRLRQQVPAGPFSIQDLPVVSGQGEARVVVRDLLGRDQVIVQPYYASPRLLQRGLQEYSYELGFARENFGLAGNDYGRALAVGTHRRGLGASFTGEVHAEVLRSQQTVGLGGVWLWSRLGVFNAALGASRSDLHGRGGLVLAGFERQSRRFGFGGSVQAASRNFTQLGLAPDQPAPRQSSRVFVNLPTTVRGSFELTYTQQLYRDREDVRLASLNYGVTLGGFRFLSVSVLRFLGSAQKTSLGLSLTLPLGERTSASVSATAQAGGSHVQLQAQRNLPVGSGIGWRVLAGAGDIDRQEAGVSAQNEVGLYTLAASRFQGDAALRAGASGGVALLGGSVRFTRPITDSFAVVQVPGYSNVRIYADNQLVARTDARGNALLPRLRPYQQNPIRIEQADLPLDAQIDALQLQAVPYFRSGLLLRFPVRRSHGALLGLVMDNGEPVPAGAVARIKDSSEEFPVGLRGEVYLTGLSAQNRLRVSWRGRSCEIAVSFPETGDPLPHLGTHLCPGVTP